MVNARSVLMGDFNLGQIDWENEAVDGRIDSEEAKFLDKIQDLYLYQHVRQPTRFRSGQEPSRLDLVFTNDETMSEEIYIGDPLCKSDHAVLSWTLFLNSRSNILDRGRKPNNLNFSKANFEGFRTTLQSVDWSALNDLTVEDAWCFGKSTIKGCFTVHVPEHKTSPKNRAAPWWNKELTKEVKRKFETWKRYSKTKSKEDYELYAAQRNKTTNAIREERHKYETLIVSSIKQEPKKLFKYIRSQQRVKPAIHSIENGTGLTTNERETAETLQYFFTSVFVVEVGDPMPHFQDLVEPDQAITDIDITIGLVKNELEKLSEHKAPGPDGIPNIVLKQCAAELALPLQRLFNKSLKEGTVPRNWRKVKVVPIYKKGSKSKPGNYRPVSLTSQVGKVMERIVKNSLADHLETNGLLSIHQHGFTSQKSCKLNLLEALEHWTKALDDGRRLDILYLNFHKAFDSVPHKQLKIKLYGYGIRGVLLEWISSFLEDRQQQVVVGAGQSDWCAVTSGVPQGSVLGPILFVLYVNELPDFVRSNIKMFADDAKVYRSIQDLQDTMTLQQDVAAFEQWSSNWLLRFNETKCKIMHCGIANPHAEYVMTDSNMAAVKMQDTILEKDLGVYISSDLKPSTHCKKAAAKGMSALRLMKQTFDR